MHVVVMVMAHVVVRTMGGGRGGLGRLRVGGDSREAEDDEADGE